MIFLYVDQEKGVIQCYGKDVAFFELPAVPEAVEAAIQRGLSLVMERQGFGGEWEAVDSRNGNILGEGFLMIRGTSSRGTS